MVYSEKCHLLPIPAAMFPFYLLSTLSSPIPMFPCNQHVHLYTHRDPTAPHVPTHTGPPPHNLFSTPQTDNPKWEPVTPYFTHSQSQAPCGPCPSWPRAGTLAALGSFLTFAWALPGLGCSSLQPSPPQTWLPPPPAPMLTSLPSTHQVPASLTYLSPLLAILARMYTRWGQGSLCLHPWARCGERCLAFGCPQQIYVERVMNDCGLTH